MADNTKALALSARQLTEKDVPEVVKSTAASLSGRAQLDFRGASASPQRFSRGSTSGSWRNGTNLRLGKLSHHWLGRLRRISQLPIPAFLEELKLAFQNVQEVAIIVW